jgi:Type IV secretion-system coupling protein DNA-binding domain
MKRTFAETLGASRIPRMPSHGTPTGWHLNPNADHEKSLATGSATRPARGAFSPLSRTALPLAPMREAGGKSSVDAQRRRIPGRIRSRRVQSHSRPAPSPKPPGERCTPRNVISADATLRRHARGRCHQRLWFVVGETDGLGTIDSLKDPLTRLRKVSGRSVRRFQSIARVNRPAGQGEAQTIVKNCVTR